jgi:hypothetical protein
MPYKKNDRNKNDAIHPDNVTGYYFAGTRKKRFPIPGEYDNPLYGVTGYITNCGRTIGSNRGEWNQCIDGYDEITYIYNKEGVIDDTSQAFGDETYNSELLANRGESNFISYTAPGATQNQVGNICQQGTVDGCKCISRHDRRACKRNLEKKPYGGDPSKCCLESNPDTLMEMDCDPKYFKTSDGLDVSVACEGHIDTICGEPPAYNLDNSKVELDSDYIKLCGCNYPEEYYTMMAQAIADDFPGITTGQLGDRVCWAPTCVNADMAVQPTLKNNCPDNNFMSCINSVVINNSGIFNGEIDVTQTNECQQYIEESLQDIEQGGDGGIKDNKYKCVDNKCVKDKNGEYDNNICDGNCKSGDPSKPEDPDDQDYMWLWILISILTILLLLGGGALYFFSSDEPLAMID